MGNTNLISDTRMDPHIDGHVVNLNIPKINTNHIVQFTIYHQINGQYRLMIIDIKTLDDNLFIYLTTEDRYMQNIHVSKINIGQDVIKSIQLSNDCLRLTIPNQHHVDLYDLSSLYDRNVIHYIRSFDESLDVSALNHLLFKNHRITVCMNHVIISSHNTPDIIKELDYKLNDMMLKFTTTGKYMAMYVKKHNKIYIESIFDSNHWSVDGKSINDLICISDNGTAVFYKNTENKFYINTIEKKEYIICGIDNTTNIKFYLINYDHYIKILGLIGWNVLTNTAIYWIVSPDAVQGPFYFNPSKLKNITYLYNNGGMAIYRSGCQVHLYNLNRIIPLKYIHTLIDRLYIKIKHSTLNKKYHKYIDIIGADESMYMYEISDYMQLLLGIEYGQNNNIENSVSFHMNVTANIDIYDNTKSFSIYHDLLIGKITQQDIINNIMQIRGLTGRHNTMQELMIHMYEYTNIFMIQNINMLDPLSEKKLLYVGYILLILVIKYSFNTNYQDIWIEFNQHFPIFVDFMKNIKN